jgi:uncharacterized membrane protein YdfJ with MMPL/SSD domain
MLERLARLTTRHPRRVIAVAIASFLLAGWVGGSAFDVLKPFGFVDPDSESARLDERVERITGEGAEPSVIALVEPGAPIRSAGGKRELRAVERELRADPAIARTASWLGTRDPAFVSTDGRAAYVAAFLATGTGESEGEGPEDAMVERLRHGLEYREGVTLGGGSIAQAQIGERVESDLQRAELLALPLILLISFLVFRSGVAALLPPMVGVLAIVGTLCGLRLLGEGLDISIFAINLVTGLGLGLAIDYSLFIVSRYREELARRGPGAAALRATIRTAGRTVLFSSLTVAAALAALVVFPQRFLYSMGVGGAMVALLAALIALTVLPAVLHLLGERVNALAPRRLRRAAEAEARGEQGRWYRFSRWVMRRPGAIAITTAAVMIAMGVPFLDARFVFADASVLPTELSSRQVDGALESRFDARRLTPIEVGVSGALAEERTARRVERLRRQAADLADVRAVSPPRQAGPGLIRLDVVQGVEDFSQRGEAMVEELRGLESGLSFAVGGNSAALVDQKASLADHLAIAVPIIAVATFLLLFLMTGSVVLPVKALLMNLLTVSAAFGILVLVFQDGRLEGLLDFTSQGALDSSQPILLFALIFGLSTDYGVFLLTRIKEARDNGASDNEAVAIGLERTGRIVTFAALLFCVAIGSFVTSEIVFLKEVGLGTAVGVMIDATIVRALLVPSLMRLLGRWNWWSPRPLRRLHSRVGLSEA